MIRSIFRSELIDRAGSSAQSALRHAAQKKSSNGVVSVRADHDQVGAPFFGVVGDFASRVAQEQLGDRLVSRAAEPLRACVDQVFALAPGFFDQRRES